MVQPETLAISVVVPAHDASASIEPCVRALQAQTLPRERFEVIVVDDASRDDTAERARHAGARVVRLMANVGPAAARNAGIAAARGRTIVFTDADCEATPDFVAALAAHLEDPTLGGSKGVYLSRQRAVTARFVQLEYESRYRHTARQRSVDFVDTYACCFRRSDLERVGGFDPRLRRCEDQDLSFRLAEAGVRIRFAPMARTFHLHSETPHEYIWKKFRTARWKARVLRRHPRKLLHDSHTPALLKAEIVAACGLAVAAASRLIWRESPRASVAFIASLCSYLGLTAPFLLNVARRDPAVARVAPLLLFGRDVALGSGLAVGFIESCASWW